MKKIKNQDLLYILFLIGIFLIFVFALIKTDYLYGSRLDWEAQHIAIPEYIRTLFYDTHEFLPNFAFNVGSGQNIYNFAYYGFLSPFIFLSYLFPFINMTYYLITISILVVIISTILIYLFLKNKFSKNIAFLCSFLFMFATSISFHSHRHIMFILYMPFLILGFFGVDKYWNNKQKTLLIISIFLMIMTSFYFSISGILCLVFYSVYVYLAKKSKITLKELFQEGMKFIIPIIIGIMMSLVLLLPTLSTLLNNRSTTKTALTLGNLLLPKINLEFLLYNAYGIGLSAIAIIAIISLLFSKKKENLFLGIVFSLLLLFPVFNYVLNGMMYIDAKIFIPLLPLCIFVIATFFHNLINNEIKLKKLSIMIIVIICLYLLRNKTTSPEKLLQYGGAIADTLLSLFLIFLYQKTKKEYILIVPLIIMTFVISFKISELSDTLVTRENFLGNKYQDIIYLTDEITENDNSFYRITNTIDSLMNINRTYNNPNYYHSTIYSSISNLKYNEFYYDTMNNPIQMRNRVITAANMNVISNIFLSNKYLISNSAKVPLGYSFYDKKNDVYAYKNDNVLPVAYVASYENVISEKEFNELDYPYNIPYLLNSIVASSDNKNYKTPSNEYIKEIEIDLNELDTKNLEITKSDDEIIILSNKKTTLNLSLPKEFENHILFIDFDMLNSQSCSKGDTDIIINGIRNVLTCSSWKYHNGNYHFNYQLGLNDNTDLNIVVGKGKFVIKNIEFHTLDYNEIKNTKESIDEFIFDKNKTKGDIIEGSINVKDDGYFTISIPYDKGWRIFVDDQVVHYEKTNIAFIGFKITSGYHDIKMIYKAPLKTEGLIGSSIGLLMFISYIIMDRKKIKI